MNKNKILSGLFVILGLIIICAGVYILVSYGTDILSTIKDFATTSGTKLSQCGAQMPPEFNMVKTDYDMLMVPALYFGSTALLVVLSLAMFLAGYYYHKGRAEDEVRKKEEIEREMIRKASERVARQKAKEAEDAASRAMEEELEKPQAEAQEEAKPAEEETPTQMIVRKRRR